MHILAWLNRFFQSIRDIVRTDAALLQRTPRLGAAMLVIAFVPALYALIYLSSVWDPNAKTKELPAGIVNLDQGFNDHGRLINVGAELAVSLDRSHPFDFRALADAEAARRSVRLGELAFAVIIPRDFSANAVPGLQVGGGKITVVLSEGNNYAAAGIARRFAADLGHEVNKTLNEKRWEQVLLSADGTGRNLASLKAGVTQLLAGARGYTDGVLRYRDTATQLATGLRQIGAGVREIQDRLPGEEELKALKSGAQSLTLHQRELGVGMEQLQAGAYKLADGVTQLREETANIPFFGGSLAAGADNLVAGSKQLSKGLNTALVANERLARGAARVESGVARLSDGMGVLSQGIQTMAGKLPENSRLDDFIYAGRELERVSSRLHTGIDTLASALPAAVSKPDGSARGLADSVEPTLEVLAPVANNGNAFAPNMIAMALWLGAVMALYPFNVRKLAIRHAGACALAKTVGRILLPTVIVFLQTGLVWAMLVYGLGLVVPDPSSFSLTMLATGPAFLCIIYLLLRVFGEVGKLLVILLLTLQLAAGGGVMPIELTADFFQAVHGWLPFTWVIKALRASLFGAFDHGWLAAWLQVLLMGALALALATLGRWRTVADADYHPAIDL